MEKNVINQQSLYDIDSCHKVICLDDEEISVKVRPVRENISWFENVFEMNRIELSLQIDCFAGSDREGKKPFPWQWLQQVTMLVSIDIRA